MSFDVCAGFIGFADTIAEIISDHPVQDRDDDQLYYTKLYLDQEKRVWVYIYVLYGGICTVWGYLYCICTVWVYLYCMGVSVLYGGICTVWGYMYCIRGQNKV